LGVEDGMTESLPKQPFNKRKLNRRIPIRKDALVIKKD